MGTHWNLWEPTGTCENLLDHVGTCGSLWQLMGIYGNLWKFVGTCKNLWELVRTSGNLKELVGTCRDLWELSGTSGNSWELVGREERESEREREYLAGSCYVWYYELHYKKCYVYYGKLYSSYVAYVYTGKLVSLIGNQQVRIFLPKSKILFYLSLALIWCQNFQDWATPVGGVTWPILKMGNFFPS